MYFVEVDVKLYWMFAAADILLVVVEFTDGNFKLVSSAKSLWLWDMALKLGKSFSLVPFMCKKKLDYVSKNPFLVFAFKIQLKLWNRSEAPKEKMEREKRMPRSELWGSTALSEAIGSYDSDPTWKASGTFWRCGR